jgi:hypothetical protein
MEETQSLTDGIAHSRVLDAVQHRRRRPPLARNPYGLRANGPAAWRSWGSTALNSD